MLVLSRFRYDDDATDRAQAELGVCAEQLAACAGNLSATVGRAVDDPTLWVLATTWEHVGAYRRALSTYDVKVQVVPLLSHALDEPSAFEVVVGAGATEPNVAKTRGESGAGDR